MSFVRTLYFLINLAAFALMGLDKAYVRRGGWRVPEKTLFGAALLGGAVGGTIGVFFFRHKTRHWYFRYGLVDIYADHGISATSTKRRKAFNRLIEDCKSGAVTYIITKQVSRFARNTADCVRICRELKKLDPPVAVYFETEGLNTLSPNSELYLTFMAALAQGESDAKSLSMKWAIRSRFERKIPRITRLYGFDRHKLDSAVALEPNGIRNALPHNKDIENVRMMYRWLLEGCNLSEIQNRLYTMKIPSPEGHPKWSTSSIRYVLSNEKYCGDIIMQKTFIEDVLDHKAVKNIGQEPIYVLRGVLPAAISPAEWSAAQRILGSIPLNQRLDEDAAKLGPWENMHLFQY